MDEKNIKNNLTNKTTNFEKKYEQEENGISFEQMVKNKFNSQLVQNEKQIEMIREALQKGEYEIYYKYSNYASKRIEQMVVTENHIFLNVDNELKIIVDDLNICEKIIQFIKDNYEIIKSNSEQEKTLPHTKASVKRQLYVNINNENYVLTGQTSDPKINEDFAKIITGIKNIILDSK